MKADLLYALRIMSRNPTFTAVVLLVLALGIGTNSALFSVVNGVLLQPLPYPGADDLLQIGRELPGAGSPPSMRRSNALMIPQFMYWRDHNRSFVGMALYDGRGGGTNLVEGGAPERVPSIRVSPEFFDVLGISPQLGRAFLPEDSVTGAAGVAVISDGLWRRRFGSDPSMVGKTLRLSGESHTVVGVMARGFDFINEADVWTPLTLEFDPQGGAAVYYVVARRKPDVAVEAAQSDMTSVGERLRADHPALMREGEGIFVQPYLDQVVGTLRLALLVLAGAVGLVLLITCANVANLLLARSTARGKEIALRAALGAGRLRIIRQLLTESALLALLGGLLGFAVARWGVSLLVRLGPGNLPRLADVRVDGTVLWFTLGISLVTVILFGLFPALQMSRLRLHEAIKEGARSGAGKGRGRARGFLVVSEVALALILLIGSALLMNSFLRITRLDPGYDYEHVLTAKMSFGDGEEVTTERFTGFVRQVAERLEGQPGIEAAATISTLPLEHGLMTMFDIEGRPPPEGPGREGRAQWRAISPGYFDAMGIPLLRGRGFDTRDTLETEPVVIINEALAAQYFPDQDPVGQGLVTSGPDDPPDRIIGVVRDIRELALDRPPTPTVFSAASQMADAGTAFITSILPTCWVVRTAGDPAASAAMLRAEILAVNPGQPISSLRSMEEVMSESIAQRQFNTLLLAIFAGQALLLAVVGIYGVMSYSVAQRTHEIGVRMALGASRGRTVKLVLGQGMRLAAAGVVLGVAGAFGLTRFMLTLLYEIGATDPPTFVAVAVALLLAAAAACLVPALRATRVDPLIALRSE